MKTLSRIFSTFFRILLIFTIAFIWSRYYIKNIWTALLVCLAATLGLDIILHLIFSKKETKNNLKKEEQDRCQNYANKLIFSENSYVMNFFFKLLSAGHEVKKFSKFLLISSEDFKICVVPSFHYDAFKAEDLIVAYNIANKCGADRLVVCTSDVDKSAENLSRKLGLNTIILNKFDTYEKLYKPANIFPEELKLKENKMGIKELISFGLNKKRTKGYLFASIILIFSSFIVKYNIYYLISSTILLILSLISFINPKFNKKVPEKILD